MEHLGTRIKTRLIEFLKSKGLKTVSSNTRKVMKIGLWNLGPFNTEERNKAQHRLRLRISLRLGLRFEVAALVANQMRQVGACRMLKRLIAKGTLCNVEVPKHENVNNVAGTLRSSSS